MHLPQPFLPISLALLSLTPSLTSADRKAEKILLSNVKTLTLRKDLKTSHRRVSAVPQLKCIGGVCDLYQVDVLRCKNQGSDYDAENIQWTCTSSLPAEFKLGATDVICEGFEGPDDPYVLKGSCGVEYRLLLTEKGEERYGRRGGGSEHGDGNNKSEKWVGVLFWCIFVGVILWMLYAIFIRDAGVRLGGGGGRNPWGGGGWGGGPGGDDPPPPYSRYSSPKQYGTAPRAGQEGWRPGFWSGALGGAAAGYMAGNRGQAQRPRDYQPTGTMWGNNDNGEGSSSWGSGGRTRSSGSSSSSFSSTRHESSGFGSTSRR